MNRIDTHAHQTWPISWQACFSRRGNHFAIPTACLVPICGRTRWPWRRCGPTAIRIYLTYLTFTTQVGHIGRKISDHSGEKFSNRLPADVRAHAGQIFVAVTYFAKYTPSFQGRINLLRSRDTSRWMRMSEWLCDSGISLA